MNNGANIIYLGTDELITLPGAANITNDANLTERSVTFCIQKNKRADALSQLVPGFAAPGFPNLKLQNPPKEKIEATHAYFDCIFYGVLSPSEGGRDEAYEYFDKLSNLADLTLGTISMRFVQPVYRYQYTVPKDAPDRNETRVIALPEHVSARSIDTGDIRNLNESSFFWEFFDIERTNYGEWDTIRESWKLSYKYGSTGD